MALYRIEIKSITRSKGRSAAAAAAYRAADKIKNLWDGVEHDYTEKGGVVHSEIMLPDNAPARYNDRSELWNAVELAEPSASCRLANECLLALPVELSLDQQIEVVRAFVKENFVSHGMCADISIHNPQYVDDLHRPIDKEGNLTEDPLYINPHAHILLTVRPITKSGKWAAKSQIEYVCKRGDEQKGFTGPEFKTAQLQGWEKQHRYVDHSGAKVWLTPSEAEERHLEVSDRVNRFARTTPHGRPNSDVAYWTDQRRVREWRKSWEEALNRKFDELGLGVRVDSRSYADQGVDRMPGVHLGPYVNNEEKRARRLEKEGRQADHTDRGEINRFVSDYNGSSDAYRKAEQTADKKITETADRMEHLRAHVAASGYAGETISKGLRAAVEAAREEEADVRTYMSMMDTLASLAKRSADIIAVLTEQLDTLGPMQSKARREIQVQIDSEQRKMDERSAYVAETLRQRGFASDADLREAAARQAEQMETLDERQAQARQMEQTEAEGQAEYRRLKDSVPDLYKNKVLWGRLDARPREEAAARQELRESLQEGFSDADYREHIRRADRALNGAQERPEVEVKEQKREQHRNH